ncbi:hypothetical protein GCM10026987_03850 [Belliella aquatica]|uniref:Uncharacterized protein n=1 Tax=Belliella aquatica TaxID=1323734 RepID=A0ABQ1M9D4_9BACT|nr:hypothetical protein GCM10010993_14790 [Belliella aquatica]
MKANAQTPNPLYAAQTPTPPPIIVAILFEIASGLKFIFILKIAFGTILKDWIINVRAINLIKFLSKGIS